MRRHQLQLTGLHDELLVDLFAGGGGASVGIEAALGRPVDVAVNHNADALSMHQANHPQTKHYHSDVFEVDPWQVIRDLCYGVWRRVGLLWASPDCTYFSKSRGGKPIRHASRRRRGLAWVVTRWAGTVRPRVIMMENVEEFTGWGPLIAKRCPKTGRVIKLVEDGFNKDGDTKYAEVVSDKGEQVPVGDQALVPDPKRQGETFRKFVRSLERLGYAVEHREMRACDFGAPTTRKRWFLIARCDSKPIVWPEPSHGDEKGQKPFRTAAECIDWSIPMLSIFATRKQAKIWAKQQREAGWPIHAPRRPLADASCRRIARGIMKYVVEAAKPFIVPIQNWSREIVHDADEPLRTITAYPKGGGFSIVAPFVRRDFGQSTGDGADSPLATVTAGGGHSGIVSTFLAQHNADKKPKAGREMTRPVSTITTSGSHQQLVAASMTKAYRTSRPVGIDEPLDTISAQGQHHGLTVANLSHNYSSATCGAQGDIEKPIKTITTGQHAMVVRSFLSKYYGTATGQSADDPLDTITTNDRFGLVTVRGVLHYINDIASRMLWPRELYRAQGFADWYQIDRGHDGRVFTKTQQVFMCGNSVPPQLPEAMVRANVPELIARAPDRLPKRGPAQKSKTRVADHA